MMDALAQGGPLAGLRGRGRTNLVDHRPPLVSPITLMVMLLHAVGFRWWGAAKRLPNGAQGTTCFIDTTSLLPDGSQERRVAWSFCTDDRPLIASEPVSIVQVCHFFDHSLRAPEKPLSRGAAAVLRAVRAADPGVWAQEMNFNERGARLVAAAANCSNPEGRRLICESIELYRGFVWKLATPVGVDPHPIYGYPLERHLRYRKGKRVGDVRAADPLDKRMEDLRMFGLR